MSDLIQDSLSEADDTDVVVMGHDVLGRTGKVFRDLFGDSQAIVIADENTWGVAGEQVTSSLRSAGVSLAETHVFPSHPQLYAGYENVEVVRQLLESSGAVACSIGSGTLNDLVKRASDELGRRYMNVCTAASMDGYAAYGASITVDGFKKTLTCRAPQALIADLPTMAAAPRICTASGLGDIIEKVPAGADWIVADALGVEPIDAHVWQMAQGALPRAISDPQGLVDGRPDAFVGLVEGLVMSGLAMQKYRISSRPASGMGHLFSHVWEMEHLGMDREPPLSHGLKVGLGAIASLALWEQVVALDLSSLDIDAAVASWRTAAETEAMVRANFTGKMVEPAVKQTLGKYLSPDELRARLELAQQQWPTMVEKARAQILPAARVEEILRTVGAIYHPSQVGLTEDRFRQTYFRCRMIRTRYTLADLLFEAGLLDTLVDKLFQHDGFWGQRPWTH